MDQLDSMFSQLVKDVEEEKVFDENVCEELGKGFNEDFEVLDSSIDNDFEESVNGDIRKFRKIIQPALQATYALARYSHGVEMDGHIYDIDRSDYPKYYHYLAREEFNKVKGGLCYDYCRFLYPYLKQKGFDVTLYFIEIMGTRINHTFPMIRVPSPSGDRYLYCESAKKNIWGCYSTTDPDGMINSIVNVFRYETIITKPTKVVVRTYDQIKSDDLTYDEILKELRKGKVYDEWVIKPRVTAGGSSAKADSAKFNPKLLIGDSLDIVRL